MRDVDAAFWTVIATRRGDEPSRHTLLDERDFGTAALLLNVLGEGTFLDLLSFVAANAPDAATATAAPTCPNSTPQT